MADSTYPGVNGEAEVVRDNRTGVSVKAPPARQNGNRGRRPAPDIPRASLNGHTTALAQWRGSQSMDHTTAGFESGHKHPILQMTQQTYGWGKAHQTQMLLWHAMREYVPILDAAIENRRRIEGNLAIESEDERLEEELRDFWRSVPVGYLGNRASQSGGDKYLNMLAETADEYGLAAGEALIGEQGREIRRLVVPNARTLGTADRDGDGIYELYQNDVDRLDRGDVDVSDLHRLDNRPTVDVLAFRASTEDEWPYPLAWSLKRVSEAFLRIFESVINGWWRFGDPSMLFNAQYEADADYETISTDITDEEGDVVDTVSSPAAMERLQEVIQIVMDARREGKVGDAYTWIDGGEITQEVLGQIDNTLMEYVDEHYGLIAAQVVEHSDTPAWMYPSIKQSGDGLGSERSQQMSLKASVAAKDRNDIKKEVARNVLDLYLTVTGQASAIGNYSLSFDRLGLLDEKVQAEANLQQAKADQQVVKTAGLAWGPEGERRFTDEAERYLEKEGIYESMDQ